MAVAGTEAHATPAARSMMLELCVVESFLPRKMTAQMAVVRILPWYATWNVAASRFETATNWRLFWIV